MRYQFFCFFTCLLIFTGCIGDDIIFDTVDPVIRITNPIDTIAIDSQFQFQYTYFNNLGAEESKTDVIWTSSNIANIDISASGLATGLNPGKSTIELSTTDQDGNLVFDRFEVVVGERTVLEAMERSGALRTTSTYTLKGKFTLGEMDDSLKLLFDDDYDASSNLPGLYVYLTNNPNSIQNATEIGKVTVFSGAHVYDIPQGIELNDFKYLLYYCKPFNVKIGDGEFEN
jgi:hypothetical protein